MDVNLSPDSSGIPTAAGEPANIMAHPLANRLEEMKISMKQQLNTMVDGMIDFLGELNGYQNFNHLPKPTLPIKPLEPVLPHGPSPLAGQSSSSEIFSTQSAVQPNKKVKDEV